MTRIVMISADYLFEVIGLQENSVLITAQL